MNEVLNNLIEKLIDESSAWGSGLGYGSDVEAAKRALVEYIEGLQKNESEAFL